MSNEDTQLWTRFLQKYASDYDSFDYDFAVGTGEDPGSSVPENFRKDYLDLTKKRIDAVGYKGTDITIFEVKPRAGTTALGQLLTYFELFRRTNPSVTHLSMAVVTELINTEERDLYTLRGIKIFVV